MGWNNEGHGEGHTCTTSDGVAIVLGLRVIDYDNRQGMVVGVPREYQDGEWVTDPANLTGRCWPQAGHNGHWWTVCSDKPGHKHVVGECRGADFDGSRMTTRGVK